MTKLEITNVQIDNYNETNNQLNKFASGLNIICGSNEAGKSTLMNFIKNVFIREKSDAKGYIKCSYNGNEFKLTPDNLKENEQYLENITAHSFKTGFIIDLDDLIYAKSSDSKELLNTIKDSSGNVINQKQKEYYDYIYGKKRKFYLSEKNKHSKQFTQQFDNLKNIENKIKELEQKENEYNSLCLEYENINTNIKLKEAECNYYELLLKKSNYENEIKNIKINQKLLQNKTELELIREEFGAYNASLKKIKDLEAKTTNIQEEFNKLWKELNNIEIFNNEKFEQFEISTENLKQYKSIFEKEKDLNKNIIEIQENIENKKEKITHIETEINSIKSQLENVGISNLEKYKKDKQLLESYLNDYSKLIDNLRNSGENINTKNASNTNVLLLLFLGILFSSIGTLLAFYSKELVMPIVAVILVSIVGINSILIEKYSKKNAVKNNYNKSIIHNKNEIIKLLNNYSFECPKDNDFIVKTNSYILTMNSNLTEYKIISDKINLLEIEKENEEKYIESQNQKYIFMNKSLSDTQKEKEEFIQKTSIKNFNQYEEIFELLKELKQLKNKENENNIDLSNTEKLKEGFISKVNEYLDNCELISIPKINKYNDETYSETIKLLQDNFDENYKNNLLITDKNEEIKNIVKELENYENKYTNKYDEITQNIVNEERQKLQILIETKAITQQKLEELKQVSGISGLRTEKQTELNKIRHNLNNLIIKELVYNIIEKSKEKFNEVQPNLVSAKEYLSKITNGKYTNIDFENKNISGEHTAEKDWDNLSRGTKEQLYLALRLGYANNYSKDKDNNPNGLPNLPLIIDDAFVNFDKERTNAILKCLEEFSKTNQVMYFTCHSETIKELLTTSKIKHNLIEL